MAGMERADALRRWIDRHRRVFVLTGAGCSTASGIPDYRDENGEWKRRPPVMIQAFRTQQATYQRYWARAYAGWPRFSAAAPGDAHRALAAWERAGSLAHLVTQNVDGLHQQAGSRAVIDLHGRLDVVVCLGCGDRAPRDVVQQTMAATNRSWQAAAVSAPDGDADIDAAAIESFAAPRCERCGGQVKPDVVFFGENVPAPRYGEAREALARADALLVAGSSLMVYSGFRFVRQAHEAGLPIAILNRGLTRGDELADLKIEGDVGTVLTQATDRGLEPRTPTSHPGAAAAEFHVTRAPGSR
ncbi:MAG TPA: NAD-dependent protein deacetylase [Vicinamibacterales bacterium]|nr:NAD-dependent protein deacetylase [Vicinamibacterales bacterium]